MTKKVLISAALLLSVCYLLWLGYIETHYPRQFEAEGKIDQCCCEGNLIKDTNTKVLPILDNISNTEFFKYFKVNLNKECPFWVIELICTSRDTCGVDDEVLVAWIEQQKTTNKVSTANELVLDSSRKDSVELYSTEDTEVYVNLKTNIESYTGYQGQRIWNAIYKENCFEGKDHNQCIEERMLYRMISGLHTSISTQLSWFYVNNDNRMAPNISLFYEKVGDYPDRIRNLYFAYSVLLRAINVAEPYITAYNYTTGNFTDDMKTKQYMDKLLNETVSSCFHPFKEEEFFQDINNEDVKKQFITKFNNITTIMDCIECEKCKVYGKMQIQGFATAFKILFADKFQDEKFVSPNRQELIALVNTFIKLATSIKYIDRFYQGKHEIVKGYANTVLIASICLLFLWLVINKITTR